MTNATKTAKRILSVTLHRDVDTDPDFSFLGEYASRPGPDDKTIDREERGDCGRGEYRYFIAANSAKETGNPESVEQDYQRMEDYNRQGWCMIGVYATAEIVLTGNVVQHVRSGGLWGIESDSEESYLTKIEVEELSGLRAELSALGFTKLQIAKAIHKAERKHG